MDEDMQSLEELQTWIKENREQGEGIGAFYMGVLNQVRDQHAALTIAIQYMYAQLEGQEEEEE